MAGKRVCGLREAELVAHEIHQVGGILAVVDGEGGIEADLVGVVAQQPRAEPWKVPAQLERVGHHAGAVAHDPAGDALDAPRHLGGGAAREGHQQDAARIGPADDQMRDAVRQRVGLARACAGDHQQRRRDVCVDAMDDGPPLRGVQRVEIARGELGQIDGLHGWDSTSFRFCSQSTMRAKTGAARLRMRVGGRVGVDMGGRTRKGGLKPKTPEIAFYEAMSGVWKWWARQGSNL